MVLSATHHVKIAVFEGRTSLTGVIHAQFRLTSTSERQHNTD